MSEREDTSRKVGAQPGSAGELNAAIEAHRAGRVDEAEVTYRRILTAEPGNCEARHMLGVVHLQNGRREEALASFQKAIAGNPSDARYHNNLGNALISLGRPGEALPAFQRSVDLDDTFLTALYNRGTTLLALGRTEEAAKDLEAVLAREPGNLNARTNLGAVLIKQKRLDEAVGIFRDGLAAAPGEVGLLANLASALEMQNKLDESAAVADEALSVDPNSKDALFLLARLDHRKGRLGEARERLRGLLKGSLAEEQEMEAWFELGLVLDRLGEAQQAFEAFQKANNLQMRSPAAQRVDAGRFLKRVSANRQWFNAERIGAAKLGNDREERGAPVFFVGFSRSGTTLVERALAAHPRITTTEESSPLWYLVSRMMRQGDYPDMLSQLGTEALEQARSNFWAEAERVHGSLSGRQLVDKLPLNIVELGLANILFPQAKVVVALRDPRDVCLSCYMQHFKLNDAMANFLDPETTVRSYKAVMELWLHYREFLSLPWMEYRYEDMVADFEGTMSKLLAFMGLEWHSDMAEYRERALGETIKTPSYRDVADEIYDRATGRWRAYRNELAPQFDALAPMVAAFAYPSD